MEGHPIRGLVIIFSLVLLNAVITAARAALEHVNESEVNKRAENEDIFARRVLALIEMPHRYINLFSIVVTTTGMMTGIVFAFDHYKVIVELIRKSLLNESFMPVAWFFMVLIIILLIYFVVLLGSLLPRKLGIKYAEDYAYRLSGIFRFLILLFRPFIWLLEKNTNILLRALRINPDDLEDNVTEDEIISMMNEGHEQGVFEADKVEMISNIIEFNEKEAYEIMTHRMKIVAISDETTIEEALTFMLEEKFSRFPLYQGNIDNIIGILHLRDVMLYYLDPELRFCPLIDAAREPYLIPDTRNIDVLFKDMQLKKMHMAIAIDEYGQTAGLVAMEDILEEIVGDIQDEYDDEAETIILTEDKDVYLVQGEAELDELEEMVGIRFDEEDIDNFDTVNGFLISKLEHIPDEDEMIVIDYNGFQFDIKEIKNKVIQSVHVRKLTEDIPEEQRESSVEESVIDIYIDEEDVK